MNFIKSPKLHLVWHTPNPRKVIAVAGRMTYSNQPASTLQENISDDEIGRTVKAILERRHWSVLRHVSYCFIVEGVSRAFSHQLVRHTAGHAFEQRSQHYRTEKDPSYIQPDTIDPWASTYQGSTAIAELTYNQLLAGGVPKEDARMILPTGIETQLIWTANLEAILNFVKTRACRVNTSEIMSIAVQVRNIVIKTFPEAGLYLGPTCWSTGICFEGRKFDTVCKQRPWKRPVVVWGPEFPREIDLRCTTDKGEN